MLRLLSALVVLVVSLGGCAAYQDTLYRNSMSQDLAPFPEHYVQFDAAVGWQVQKIGNDLVIDGIFKNVRYDWMDSVQMRVEAINPAGKTVGRSVSLLFPSHIALNQVVPFTLRLTTPVPGSKLRFTYIYSALSGAGPDESGGDTGFWMQSFDAKIPD